MTIQERFAALSPALLDWFRQSARDLPWRGIQDPYRIWISEIMLQQTRVAAVLGYYARFLEAFPDVYALAAAPEERLLSLWQGLGYYSRARNLHKTAKLTAERGGFPDTYEELLKLPGVGAYTAGAIASAAFGRRTPAVDGNVMRAAARIADCHQDIRQPETRKHVTDLLSAVFPETGADIRIYNQAWMELGAVVCGPNGPPRCETCPVKAWCLGRERGNAERLPVRGTLKPRRQEDRTVMVLLRGGRTALRKRPKTGLLAGLWEFPNVPGTLDESGAAAVLRDWDLQPVEWLCRMEAKHIFTHVEWHMTGYVLTVSGDGDALDWVDEAGLAERAVPSAFVRFRAEAAERLSGEGETV